MKKILIIGENSYLGQSLREYLNKEQYMTQAISVRNDSWKDCSFKDIDVIYYVAAIVHCSEKEVSKEEYYRVNYKLPSAVAAKAKKEGVKQFIFTSTMSVYGLLTGKIDSSTKTNPGTLYGKSKLLGEEGLLRQQSEEFIVTIVRPPMIYGKGCKGNYEKLKKLAVYCPVFPKYPNKRSMLYIKNLNFFIEQIIEQERGGIYCPQDAKMVNTYEMVRLIRKAYHKRTYSIKICNPLISLLQKRISLFQKVWGNLCYDPAMSKVQGIEYQKITLAEAIAEIEEG